MTGLIDTLAYAKQLYLRRREARVVPFLDITSLVGWAPLPQRCHDNVDRLASERPEYQIVRGWHVSDRADTFAFLAHSVVRGADGGLIDITPVSSEISWRYPFLEDDSPEFMTLANFQPSGEISCPAEGRCQQEIARRNSEMFEENIRALMALSRWRHTIGT